MLDNETLSGINYLLNQTPQGIWAIGQNALMTQEDHPCWESMRKVAVDHLKKILSLCDSVIPALDREIVSQVDLVASLESSAVVVEEGRRLEIEDQIRKEESYFWGLMRTANSVDNVFFQVRSSLEFLPSERREVSI